MNPRDLPKWRTQTVRHLADPTSPLRADTGADRRHVLDALQGHLTVGDLYYATADMAALAVSAGAQLAAARWATADRPSPCGLIAFQGGIGYIAAQGVDVPVDAVAWGPHNGDLLVWCLLSRRRLATRIATTGAPFQLQVERMPPLLPTIVEPIPVTADPAPLAETDMATVLAALAASWLLMQQPQLVDRTRETAGPADRRRAHREGRPSPDVTVVDLRRQYTPNDRHPEDEGRRHRHRWVVSGHWRNQPHGPGRAQRRQQWIPAYVKGPDGAPLLATERVNVWKR